MSYFDMFPNIYYSAKGDGKFTIMKDLLARVKLIANVKDNILGFDYYDVKDGETPEMIAHKYYDDPELHWTILVANEVIDYYSDWPMSVQKFEQFVKDKYSNPQATKHHVTTEVKDANNNIIVPAGKVVASNFQVSYYNGSTTVTANPVVSVTNAMYETEVNSKKQNIQVVKPNLIEDFVAEYKALLLKGKITTIAGGTSDINM